MVSSKFFVCQPSHLCNEFIEGFQHKLDKTPVISLCWFLGKCPTLPVKVYVTPQPLRQLVGGEAAVVSRVEVRKRLECEAKPGELGSVGETIDYLTE